MVVYPQSVPADKGAAVNDSKDNPGRHPKGWELVQKYAQEREAQRALMEDWQQTPPMPTPAPPHPTEAETPEARADGAPEAPSNVVQRLKARVQYLETDNHRLRRALAFSFGGVEEPIDVNVILASIERAMKETQ